MNPSESFEHRLERAIKVDVGDDLVDALLPDLTERPAASPATSISAADPRRARQPLRRLALAASVLVVLAAGVIAWQVSRPAPSVEDYVRDHYRHDGAMVLARAGDPGAAAEVTRMLARFGAAADADLADRVRYIKFCPTPHGRGAHMIVATERGPVTVIFMPETRVEAPVLLRFDGVIAEVVALEAGAAAIIGPEASVDDRLAALVRTAIRPIDGKA